MRTFFTGFAVAALIGLAGCSPPAEEVVAPAPKKSLARQAQFYQGQEQVQSIVSGAIAVSPDGALQLTAASIVPSAGYTDTGFEPRIYAAPPPDGVYEVDVVATRPAGVVAQVVTPLEIKGSWSGYKKERLKGVKMISRTNEVVAMLPAG